MSDRKLRKDGVVAFPLVNVRAVAARSQIRAINGAADLSLREGLARAADQLECEAYIVARMAEQNPVLESVAENLASLTGYLRSI